jgi:hypothetical protein
MQMKLQFIARMGLPGTADGYQAVVCVDVTTEGNGAPRSRS